MCNAVFFQISGFPKAGFALHPDGLSAIDGTRSAAITQKDL
jgi:hypothetical protein